MDENTVNNLISTFFVGDTRWGINIIHIQEIINIQDITKVHNAPDYIEGIINLRGKIVTVLSLSKRLNIESVGDSNDNRIVIVNINDEFVGLLVDSISDVVKVDLNSLMPAPSTVNGTKGSNIDGIYHHKDFTIAILNLDCIFNTEKA